MALLYVLMGASVGLLLGWFLGYRTCDVSLAMCGSERDEYELIIKSKDENNRQLSSKLAAAEVAKQSLNRENDYIVGLLRRYRQKACETGDLVREDLGAPSDVETRSY